MTLVASALAGGDCIDDADVLRTGGTAGAIGCVVKAPSTLGTFLRSFRWGHVVTGFRLLSAYPLFSTASCSFTFSVAADGREHGSRAPIKVLITRCPRAARVKRVPLRPLLSTPRGSLIVVPKAPYSVPYRAVLVNQNLLG